MAEIMVSLFFLLLSLIYLFFAQDLTFGTLGAPKAGFLPMVAGGIAVVLSLMLVIKLVLQNRVKVTDATNWRKFILIIAGLVIYITILDVVGYFFATFIIMFYLLKVTDTIGWACPLFIAAGVSVVGYLLFREYLNVYLP